MVKEKTTIYLDAEVKERAVELGLNLSKTAENALKDVIQKLTGLESKPVYRTNRSSPRRTR